MIGLRRIRLQILDAKRDHDTPKRRFAPDKISMQIVQDQRHLHLEAQAAFLLEWKRQLAALDPKERQAIFSDPFGDAASNFTAMVEARFKSNLHAA